MFARLRERLRFRLLHDNWPVRVRERAGVWVGEYCPCWDPTNQTTRCVHGLYACMN
jgi:hypothetical protein